MSITVTGITNGPENKVLIFFDIDHNGTTYNWKTYKSSDDETELMEYLEARIGVFTADIDAKEAIWAESPHTREEIDPMTGETRTVDISKDEVVFPTLLSVKDKFDAEKAIGREAKVFTMDRLVSLAPFSYTINEFIRFKNFTQLKQFTMALIGARIALPKDYDILNSILKEQGIDMDVL